jgi:hypothetical protein
MKRQLLSLLLVSFSFLTVFGEETSKIKFGKVSESELTMTSYAADTAAVAVILSDIGTSDVEYNPEQGFTIQFNRHVRIKILKQQGAEWGNFKVLLYKSPNSKEEIGSLKGLTFNLEGGQVLKSELKKESIFTEKENKFWEATRFSLPAVKVGSVIDVQYRITSNILWNLHSWKFQYSIPVKLSEYAVTYPEYFLYNQTMMGFHPLSDHKTERNPATFRISSDETLSFLRTRHYYLSKDVPGIKEEPYMTTIDNYTSKIEFELAQTDFSKIGGTYKNYTTSWEDVVKELLLDDDFGLQIKNGNFVNDIIKEQFADSKDNLQKAIKIYEYIKNKVKWNEYNSVYSSKPLRKVLSDGKGNVADINLLLTLMLNRAGVDAYPVILSTRNNGMLSPAHASISRCNYVIVQATIEGKKYLLDATEPDLPFGLIPFRCLNVEGRLVKENEPVTVALSCNKRITNNLLYLSFNENSELTGELNSRYLGHDALNLREEIKEAGGKKEYIETLKNKNSELEILECDISNIDSIYNQLTNKYKVKLKNSNEMMDAEVIYIDPILVAKMKDNPFSAPSRVFPIDFGTPFNETYQIQLTIPKGYIVDELPKTANFSTEGKSGSFLYQASQLGDKIIINTILSVEKPIFVQTEYLIIKNFFDTVIAKQTEQIVLKKTGV